MSSSNQVTVQSLKEEAPPQSPKKYEGTLRCAVLSKSPLKPTRYGKMFLMSLSGKDSSSTVQAVCFEESMFNEFKAKKSYDVQSFKVKKGFGACHNQVEVLIDHSTSVEESPDQWTDCIIDKIFKNIQIVKLITTALKSILKLVKLQCLVAKCCKMQKIQACKICKFCILL